MMRSSGHLVILLSAAAVLVVTGLFALAARAARRHDRRRRRRHALAFRRRCLRLAREGEGAEAVRRAAAALDERAFWGAVERLALVLAPHRRARLGAALARSAHLGRERRALAEDSPWRAELAARRLALLPAAAHRPALRRALRGASELAAYAAALALGGTRDRGALRWLLAHPRRFARRDTRAWATLLRAFGRRGHSDLAAALEREVPDPRLERALVEVLGVAGFGAAAPAIARRLRHTEPEVRVAAARAVGRLDPAAHVAALIDTLEDPDWPVRAQTAWALGRARDPRAVLPLAVRLTDRAWWVRRHAAYALAAIGPQGIAALRHALSTSPDPYARDISAEALDGGFPPRARAR
jgi:HEAT repeat protein